MNDSPLPDGGAHQPERSGRAQESQMAYSYPNQPDQGQEGEIPYGYPHAAGFPQPGYPPTQPANAQANMGYAGLQQPGYGAAQQSGLALWGKTWNGLWIALTTLALLLLVAGGYIYYYFQVRSTPERTLQAYCNAVKTNDGRALYDLYSNEAQRQTDEIHLRQGLRLINFLSGGIEDCSIDKDSIHENDPQATASVTFTLESGRMNSMRLHLIDQNGQWKIEDNNLFP